MRALACVLLLGGCHHGGGSVVDGGGDGAPSCTPPVAADAAPGPSGQIDLHVGFLYDNGTQWNVQIVDAAGQQTMNLQAESDTTAMVRAPAIVTATWGFDSYTITEVAPGDALHFGMDVTPSPAHVMVTAPAAPGATYYDVYDGDDAVGVVAPPATLICAGPCTAPHDVVGWALAVPTDPQPRWSAAAAQSLADGQTVALDAWHPSVPFTATYSGLPAGDTYTIQMSRQEMSSADVPVAAGSVQERPPAIITSAPAGAAPQATYATSAFGGTRMKVFTSIVSDNRRAVQSDARVVPAAASLALDASTDLLPWIRGGTRCDTTASWTQSGGRTPDGVWLSMSGGPLDPEEHYPLGHWYVLVRPGATTIELPPAPFSPLGDGVGVLAVDFANVDGYDALRSVPVTATPDATSAGGG